MLAGAPSGQVADPDLKGHQVGLEVECPTCGREVCEGGQDCEDYLWGDQCARDLAEKQRRLFEEDES